MKNKKIGFIILLITLPIIALGIYLTHQFGMMGFLALIALVVLGYLFHLILKDPFIGISLTIATLPFERIPTLDIGLFTLKIDQVFAGMTIVSWVLKLLFSKNKFQPYPIGWPLGIFVFLSLISMMLAVDHNRAFSVLVFTIFMIIVSFMTTNIVDSEKRLETVVKIFLYAAFFVSLFGLYQFAGDIIGLPNNLTGLKDIYSKAVMGFPRIQAFSMEPLFLANYLFIPLGLALSLYIFKENKIASNTKLLALIALISIVIVLGISRGAYIALGFFASFFVFFMARKFLTFKNIMIFIVGIIIVGGTSYEFLKISRPDALKTFISHAKIEDFSVGESVQKRLADYQKAIDYWGEKPFLGIGPGNYGPRYKNYPPHSEVKGWEVVNNEYLEILAETGIFGLLFFALTILMLCLRTIKAYYAGGSNFQKAVLIGLISALIAILVQYNFFSTLYIMHIWILIGLIVAAQNLCFNSKEPR